MMKAVAAIALLAAASALAQQLQPAGSEIAFTTRQMGVPVEGRFTRFAAQVALDTARPEAGSVAMTIDTASARFGAPELDGELPKPGWLNSAKFPQASFRSTAIRAAGPGRFDVSGALTIKGSTRDVMVPVQLAPGAGATRVASGSFTINRLDFKIGEAEWSDTALLAGDVQVRFKLLLAGP